jgi:hypothetical protein
MTDPVLSTWQIHSKHIQTYIRAIPTGGLTVKMTKGRTVGAMLAHIHNSRIAWLEPAAPDLAQHQPKISKGQTDNKGVLSAASPNLGKLL